MPLLELFLNTAIPAACGGVACYVAIRSDLADLKARIVIVEKVADRAHERIDFVKSQK